FGSLDCLNLCSDLFEFNAIQEPEIVIGDTLYQTAQNLVAAINQDRDASHCGYTDTGVCWQNGAWLQVPLFNPVTATLGGTQAEPVVTLTNVYIGNCSVYDYCGGLQTVYGENWVWRAQGTGGAISPAQGTLSGGTDYDASGSYVSFSDT